MGLIDFWLGRKIHKISDSDEKKIVTFGLDRLGLKLENVGFNLETISSFALDAGKVVSDLESLEHKYLGVVPTKYIDMIMFMRLGLNHVKMGLDILDMNYSREIPAAVELQRRYTTLKNQLEQRYECKFPEIEEITN